MRQREHGADPDPAADGPHGPRRPRPRGRIAAGVLGALWPMVLLVPQTAWTFLSYRPYAYDADEVVAAAVVSLVATAPPVVVLGALLRRARLPRPWAAAVTALPLAGTLAVVAASWATAPWPWAWLGLPPLCAGTAVLVVRLARRTAWLRGAAAASAALLAALTGAAAALYAADLRAEARADVAAVIGHSVVMDREGWTPVAAHASPDALATVYRSGTGPARRLEVEGYASPDYGGYDDPCGIEGMESACVERDGHVLRRIGTDLELITRFKGGYTVIESPAGDPPARESDLLAAADALARPAEDQRAELLELVVEDVWEMSVPGYAGVWDGWLGTGEDVGGQGQAAS
ncbi:hypothetical protein ACFPZ0_02960 [Streptomonospora nanhaiensis]|uniref:Uncharacterized protein n=1 Tax=Streptomonospora nanhaiensis TaxID=1323731 RepID=A0A853BVG0_9ACTN|nr:hypothetical protein [Streptomonospora nanhaiensis]MBX9387103.1 hypothetical protein [Streptomonospora nanhaiensis]NYI98960.1 hypothetical protein [Streptomonospora nanhaiensis]